MKYYRTNGIDIIECSPAEFSIKMASSAKKNVSYANCTNGGFFWGFSKDGGYATYPLTHLVCDIDTTNSKTLETVKSMGTISNGKYTYDNGKSPNSTQFANKSITTFYVKGSTVGMADMLTLGGSYDYAIGGIPVMKSGEDVKFYAYVKGQGWLGSELYGTWHTFIGLKKGSNTIYLIGYKSTSSNLIYSAECYKKFKAMGFYDVMKLDGGGSYVFKANGKIVSSTTENRVLNNFIVITPKAVQPTTTTVSSWQKATDKGILDGTNPSNNLTREQLAIVLDRLGLLD